MLVGRRGEEVTLIGSIGLAVGFRVFSSFSVAVGMVGVFES